MEIKIPTWKPVINNRVLVISINVYIYVYVTNLFTRPASERD